MKTPSILLLALFLPLLPAEKLPLHPGQEPSSAPAGTRVYREKAGERIVTLTVVSHKIPEGLRLTATVGEGIAVETQVYVQDHSGASIAWQFIRPGEKTDVRAVRNREKVVLSGIYKGRPIQKDLEDDGVPWNQAFNLGLESFAAAGNGKTKFWAIGTSSPVAMKTAKFSAEIIETETTRVAGKMETARHIRISLAGIKSAFWHGDYWYRKSDGTFLLYRGRSGPGKPVSVMELIEENT